MSRVLLVDEVGNEPGGHHAVYRETLSLIDNTSAYDQYDKFPSLIKQPITGIKKRLAYVKKIPGSDVLCLLYLDTLYTLPFLFPVLKKKHKHIVGTLHAFPYNKKRQALLKMTAKYLDAIVVHSDYIGEQVKSIGITKGKVIHYPVICNVDLNRLKPKMKEDKKVFTCMGGSRSDKGPDILAQSLQFIPPECRDKVRIVFAGKEGDVPYAYIKEQAEAANVQVDFCNKVLSDEEYWQFISDTDVILVPYKRIFMGNSGPLTDGSFLDKYILGPDEGNLAYFINRYHLGSTFKIEDPESLGKEIARVSQIDTTCSHALKEKLNVSDFIKSYRELFESLYD